MLLATLALKKLFAFAECSKSFEKTPTIKEACRELVIPDSTLRDIMQRLNCCIDHGLSRVNYDEAVVKCYNTYVQDLPNGTEKGKFLALDLGGTNFRVLLITLGRPDKPFDMKFETYAIPPEIMTGTGQQLFDHIAECLIRFVTKMGIENERLPLGFTFSFPCKQIGLTKGILEQWTKGFKCTGVEGKDVVELLQQSLDRLHASRVETTALLNDTTGTLMSCAWKNHNTRIGLIVGTGCNACYVEKIENVGEFDGDASKPYVIINTEMGAFGSDGCLDDILTEFDREIDDKSLNKGRQIYEKIISGMYMGEIVRLMLVKFTKLGYLFEGHLSEKLNTKGSFNTEYVSRIEIDERGHYAKCREVMELLDLPHATEQDCANVRYVCEVVSTRAAHLASAGTACLINKMGFDPVTVGVDGSVYRYHPYFHRLMVEKISQLIHPKVKFDIMLSEDGSGRGAALVAAVATRDNQTSYN